MQELSKTTKLKIIIPLMYFGASILLFINTWPNQVSTHHVTGVILTIIAFILWITARVQLGNAFSIAPEAKFIVRAGLYQKLRHPVYYFSILAGLGLSIYLWRWPLFVALILFIGLQTFRIRKEETLLVKLFGKEYSDYKQSSWF